MRENYTKYRTSEEQYHRENAMTFLRDATIDQPPYDIPSAFGRLNDREKEALVQLYLENPDHNSQDQLERLLDRLELAQYIEFIKRYQLAIVRQQCSNAATGIV